MTEQFLCYRKLLFAEKKAQTCLQLLPFFNSVAILTQLRVIELKR